MRAKTKGLLKVGIVLLVTVLFVPFLYFANKQQCYHFVEELNYNCKGIGDLNNYIDYDMLSGDLKKLYRKMISFFQTLKKNTIFAILLVV